ncbi:Signal transduction histidine kinase CheA [Chitinispirillum alkaliphilum]|nr:Signal transduction histidine kinase CheA [Chitinispirillum alkaliphilum]
MLSNDNELTRKLLKIFEAEAQEHLSVLSAGFLDLEKAEENKRQPLLETLSRRAHTFKGAARTIENSSIESLCRSLESVLLVLKKKRITPPEELFDMLHRALDLIRVLLTGEQKDQEVSSLNSRFESFESAWKKSKDLPKGIPESSQSYDVTPLPKPDLQSAYGKNFLSGVVKLPAEKLEQFLQEAEEMIPVKNSLNSTLNQLNEISAKVQSIFSGMIKGGKEIFPSGTDPLHLNEISRDLSLLTEQFRENCHTLENAVHQHLQNVKSAGMEPFSEISEPLHRISRDLSRQQGKEVNLEIIGAQTEFDRRMLQELQTPFLHLIRNAVDHGIETPQERISSGKNSTGKITIVLTRAANSGFEITISDDGRGVDTTKLKNELVKRGLINSDQAEELTPFEINDLLFRSGISTRQEVSDLSGRGLGLAIVREFIEKISGQVWMESTRNKGTTFRIILPSTISTLRGVLVSVGDFSFIIPTPFVQSVKNFRDEDIKTVENVTTIMVEDEAVTLVHLKDVLNLPQRMENTQKSRRNSLIVNFAEKRIAIEVDHVIDEKEVVVRGLGPQLKNVKMIAGATISGSGQVVPVLNISDLLVTESIEEKTRLPKHETKTLREKSPRGEKTILVVEDSITSRSLLKTILQSSGFRVKTAVDGAEAYTMIRTEKFDIVLSDIDMPRMNGFELTRKIREDKKLAQLPIVLISALESKEDIQRGIEAGANAYIVKSRFDNTNLIETVKRLI